MRRRMLMPLIVLLGFACATAPKKEAATAPVENEIAPPIAGPGGKVSLLLDADPALGIIHDGAPRDIDDGLAIIESINSKTLGLGGITVVFGNSEANEGFEVARKLVELKKADIPVVKGATGPASSDQDIPVNAASTFLAEKLRAGRYTIGAIGPLTNIASLIKNYPAESKNIDRIVVVMGRSPGQQFFIGSFGPILDFNYFKDPISAKLVFESGIPVVLAPFELSKAALVEPAHLDSIRSHKSDSAVYLYDMAQSWLAFWHKNFPQENGFHPWDSAAIAALTSPDLLECERRGFRFQMVKEVASEPGEQAVMKERPWLVLDKAYPGPTHLYCYAFKQNKRDEFIRNIVVGIH